MLETLGNTFRIPELRRRVLVTVVLLCLCQIGAFIPVPGVDTVALGRFFEKLDKSTGGGLLNFVNIFTGPSLQRFAIFSLGVMPYISASIIFQLLVQVIPSLKKISEEGEAGRKKIHQWTRYATVLLCLFQGAMMVKALSAESGMGQVFPHFGFGMYMMAAGNRAMMFAMIIRDTPFPIPYSSICSPIHISNSVPVVSSSAASIYIPKPKFGKTTPMPVSEPRAFTIMAPWNRHRNTVA